MSNAREQIAEIIAKAIIGRTATGGADVASKAILAALPSILEGMIEPKWYEFQGGYRSECGYLIYSNGGTRNRYALTDPDGAYIVSPQDAILRLNPYSAKELMGKAAKDKASPILSAIGVET